MSTQDITRRSLLAGLTAGLAQAAGADFWLKKPVETWTSAEIEEMLTDSPWAKLLKLEWANKDEAKGRRSRRNPNSDEQQLVAVWESAAPVRAVLPEPLDPVFQGMRVISVSGGAAPQHEADARRQLMMRTRLTVGEASAAPIEARFSAEYGPVWFFGFSPAAHQITRDTPEVRFETVDGSEQAAIKASAVFQPRNMIYNGQLAL